jgi:hypothetical protein
VRQSRVGPAARPGKRAGIGAAEHYAIGAAGDGFGNVAAAPNPAIEHQAEILPDGIADCGERGSCSRSLLNPGKIL